MAKKNQYYVEKIGGTLSTVAGVLLSTKTIQTFNCDR